MNYLLHSTTTGISDPILRAMFAARKQVFVDLLKWDVPVLNGEFEVDQFDDAHAQYLVITDPAGMHLASSRLLPTLRPHILGDLFPWLCDETPPRGARLFEITRFCLDRRLDARGRREARNCLISALVAHALNQSILGYTAIAEMSWYRQIRGFGWRCTDLGAPRPHQGTVIAALHIAIDAATPAALAANGISGSAEAVADDLRVAA